MNVLVIDDESSVGTLLRFNLRQKGFDVDTAASAAEGYAKAQAEPFDLVILDVALPGIDGIEMLKKVKSTRPEIEVIVLTGHGSEENADEGIRLGAFDYLMKPLDSDRLLLSVRNALAARRMSVHNKQLLNDLQCANQDLERRVQERTAELAEAKLPEDFERAFAAGIQADKPAERAALYYATGELARLRGKSALAADLLEMYEVVAEEQNLEMEGRVTPGLTILGNRHLLAQALSNLLENAIKYTPAGGRVMVSLEMQSREAHIQVSDTGMGIAAEEQPKIFQRFYRCDASRSEAGMGLGLSLARALAESLGGSLTVRSIPYQGSTFTLSIPSQATA